MKWSELFVKSMLPKATEIEIGRITHCHNVDCTDYEKRIATLTKELSEWKRRDDIVGDKK